MAIKGHPSRNEGINALQPAWDVTLTPDGQDAMWTIWEGIKIKYLYKSIG